jgi:hypothetical protein
MGEIIDVAEAQEIDGEVHAWQERLWSTVDQAELLAIRESDVWKARGLSVLDQVKPLWEDQLKKAWGAKGPRPDPAL